ncbi:LysR family transcriptional regulator [Allopusillimonas soli]|uniref:TOBE domain-containing protein n=1 Tax=Allopusillimonas soli TaxID=659016 RepID=A0A853FFA1_9BURK|nr:TOBE domain-containing protein [Allopusillimonas soli]NYT38559.1 TOBE domain-containing protein [Allopusillimonas soli]TEA71726.1 LysR family transcriptional regulator [Allopusillimonas soli]
MAATSPIELSGSIALRSGNQSWGSQRRMALLEAIAREGSITAAARSVGMSYKAAWDAVDTMNNLAGEPLVLRTTGGRRGGGATLSDKGLQLLALFQQVSREHARFMSRLAQVQDASADNLELIQHMMLETSARNQLLGTVSAVRPGAVNDEVALSLAEGLDIVANITSASVQNLGLQPGRRAMALIKASSIMVGTVDGPLRISARNQLAGKIDGINKGAVNAEVRIALPSGHALVSIITMDSLATLGLKTGQPAYAIFKASSVMLGVMD